MYKTLLVPYVNRDSERAALTAALELAASCDAHVIVLVTVDVPPVVSDEWGVLTQDFFQRALDEARARAEALAQQLRARCRVAARSGVRLVDAFALQPAHTAALHARYADLAIIPSAPEHGARADSKLAHHYFRELLTTSGTPVLVVPASTAAQLPARHAVIAWQPTREASRAVHDAMPLLNAAESVDVLVVDPEVGEAFHGPQPGADIAAHLARHGLKVQVYARPSMGRTVATAILDHVREVGADLLIAGGYGHSRLREFVLGGVTRDLFESTTVPVLFAH